MLLSDRSLTGSTVLVLMLLLGAFCVVVPNQAAAAQEGYYTYTTSGNPLVATITDYEGPGGAVIIPSMLGGYRVVSIGFSAFNGKSSITSVIMPDTIITIEQQGFYWCYYMTSISLSKNLTTIGGWAFDGCHSLTTITIPASVVNLGDSAFQQNPLLLTVNFAGTTAPTNVSDTWFNNGATARGHALLTSNFPAAGSMFHGLMMGAVLPTVPNVPTGLTTTPGNAQATLTWQAPSSDGGSPITNYKLYRSSSAGGTYSLLASPSGLTYTDTGLSNGQTYWYKVTAVNVNGESAMSTQASAALAGGSDNTPVIVIAAIAIIAVVAVAVVFVLRKKK